MQLHMSRKVILRHEDEGKSKVLLTLMFLICSGLGGIAERIYKVGDTC
jgi:hypothetical protein